jgi:hypothetical protein
LCAPLINSGVRPPFILSMGKQKRRFVGESEAEQGWRVRSNKIRRWRGESYLHYPRAIASGTQRREAARAINGAEQANRALDCYVPMIMNHLEITDIFFIPKKGVVVAGDIDDTFKDAFTMGERVKIVRPDGTNVYSAIHEYRKFFYRFRAKKVGVLPDAVIVKEDVPRGWVMTIIDFQ